MVKDYISTNAVLIVVLALLSNSLLFGFVQIYIPIEVCALLSALAFLISIIALLLFLYNRFIISNQIGDFQLLFNIAKLLLLIFITSVNLVLLYGFMSAFIKQ